MAKKRVNKYLQVSKVAESLDVSEDFVRNLIRDGHLKAIKIGKRSLRISEKSFNLYLDSVKIQAEMEG